jgi:hypothetical protein
MELIRYRSFMAWFQYYNKRVNSKTEETCQLKNDQLAKKSQFYTGSSPYRNEAVILPSVRVG